MQLYRAKIIANTKSVMPLSTRSKADHWTLTLYKGYKLLINVSLLFLPSMDGFMEFKIYIIEFHLHDPVRKLKVALEQVPTPLVPLLPCCSFITCSDCLYQVVF